MTAAARRAGSNRVERVGGPVPLGYVRSRIGDSELVSRSEYAEALGEMLGSAATLHDYAASQRDHRALVGRLAVYAVTLPGTQVRVVVRHNHHGGLFARFTRDRFITPTRAPDELAIALRLADAGVNTPQVVGYALYPAGPLLRRCDVVTREVPGGRDLAEILTSADSDARRAAIGHTARLVGALTAAGARHHDLNVKNVLIGTAGTNARAYALDVDRVTFGAPRSPAILEQNLARLVRSARKWRELWGAEISDAELKRLSTEARRIVTRRTAR